MKSHLKLPLQKSTSKLPSASNKSMISNASKSRLEQVSGNKQPTFTSREKSKTEDNQLHRKLLSDIRFYQSKIDQLSKENAVMLQEKKKIERENAALIKLCEKLKMEVAEKRNRDKDREYMGFGGICHSSIEYGMGQPSQQEIKIHELINPRNQTPKGGKKFGLEKLQCLEPQNRRLQQLMADQHIQFSDLQSTPQRKRVDFKKENGVAKTRATEENQDEADKSSDSKEKKFYQDSIKQKQKHLQKLQQNPLLKKYNL